jgi:hypothetical protein
MNPNRTILVWRFEDAPSEYSDLSENGGDEDWVAFVPESFDDVWIGWIDYCNGFGNVLETHTVNGGKVYIGSHA